jgi:quercetin 2,3-dioxygenase
LSPGAQVSHRIAAGRIAYLHLVKGAVRVNGIQLGTGDGAKIESELDLAIAAGEDSEVLLFDMASP